MRPFFEKSDFVLCDVPVPKGYPQSQTHAGIAIYEGKYYLTTSPFPGPQYGLWVSRYRKLMRIISCGILCNNISGEKYENPCIYIGGKQGLDIPVHFRLMSQSPLMDTPESFFGFPSYNSDPDIFVENGVLYILNRSVIRTKVYRDKPYEFLTRIYLIKGLDENGYFKLLSNQLVLEGDENFVSPSLIKFRGKYMVAFLDNRFVGQKVIFDNLFLSIADDVEDAVKSETKRAIKVNCGKMIPWHLSLFQYKDTLYTIITCVKEDDTSFRMWQMLGEFNNNLSELSIYQTPLTDFNSYRSAACVREDGLFVLYNATVWERIRGSKSVDGRDVMMAKCLFSDLLMQIRGKH